MQLFFHVSFQGHGKDSFEPNLCQLKKNITGGHFAAKEKRHLTVNMKSQDLRLKNKWDQKILNNKNTQAIVCHVSS